MPVLRAIIDAGGKNKEYSGLTPMNAIAWMMAWESNQIGIHIIDRLL